MDATDFLDGLWYFACPSRALKPGRVLGLTLAGRPIALARRPDGGVYAVRDICPHRGIPLSFGRVAETGDLECPYHGWRFGPEGRCTLIPSLVSGQDLDLSRISVATHPVAESQGMIWVLPDGGDGPLPEVPRLPDMDDVTPDLVESQTFACHVDHAVIGLMDPAHGPFVHRAWWWRTARSMHEKAKRFVPSPLGFTMASHAPSSNSAAYRILGGARTTEIAFSLPGVRIETIRAGRNLVNILTAVTPIDAGRTQVTSMIFWRLDGALALLPLFKPVIQAFTRSFLGQDRIAVEKQQVGLAHAPRLMLINDADTQAKWYFQLKHLWAKSREAGEPFANPLKETVLRWRS